MRDADRDGGFGLRCAVVVMVFTMAPTMAFAYIDPGSGAYMVQALFAFVGAVIFYLRHPIRSLKSAWYWSLRHIRQSSTSAEADYSVKTVIGNVNEVKAASGSGEKPS